MLASVLLAQIPILPVVGLHHVLLATATCILLVVCYHGVYNRYFHPLRAFPGPFWGSVTDLYNTFLFATKESHLRQLELHEKYGIVHDSPI